MAVVMTEERKIAAKALMRHLRELSIESLVMEAGRPILLVLEGDSMREVLDRVQRHSTPVILAVHRSDSGEVTLLDVSSRSSQEK